MPGTVFRSLAVRNFRLFAGGQVLSVTGTWMMVVAQDWLVLRISGGSAAALGTVTALQFLPLTLLMLYGGRVADRYDKRWLLIAANTVSSLIALVLGTLVLTGHVNLGYVYLFAFLLGMVNAFEVPARMSFVGEVVGPELLPNASALSAAYFNVARVLGTALGGAAVAAVGSGWVMTGNAVSYAATVAGLWRIRPAELRRVDRTGPRPLVLDGLRYVASRRDLVVPLMLTAVVGLFGMNFQLTLPLLASSVFHADATTFGLLSTAFAAGSLVSALVTTGRRSRPSSMLVISAALVFGALLTLTGWVSSFVAAAGLLFLVGFWAIFFAQAANHRIQLGSDPAYRGRVLSLYSLIMQGSTPLGALMVGALSERYGVRWGFWIGGAACVVAALITFGVERWLAPPQLSRISGFTDVCEPPMRKGHPRPVNVDGTDAKA